MIKRRQYAELSAELIWMLLGIPLAVWAGVVWDAFQAPTNTQSFLGAANNFYFLWLAPLSLLGAPRALLRTALTRSPGAKLATAGLFVIAWLLAGNAINGHLSTIAGAVIPIVALLNIGLALLAWHAARGARRAGQTAMLAEATTVALVLAGMGAAVGGIVHLLGTLPTHQVFLYVDGFGNLRTLGETVVLAAAAALMLLWRRPGWFPFALAVLFVCVLTWSGTRAAWVGLGGALALGCAFWRPSWRALGLSAAAAVLGGTLSILWPTPHGTYGIARIGMLAHEAGVVLDTGLPPSTQAQDIEGSNRLQLWSWGVEQIAQAPILGHGMGSMGAIADKPDYANFKHLHNLPLDLAFGGGIPLALILTTLLLWAVFSAYAQARRDGALVLPLCAATLLATSLFAGLFLFPISMVVAGLGLSGAGWRHPK